MNIRASAIFGLERYDHYVFAPTKEGKGFVLNRRGATAELDLADDFYVRPATSANAYRVVLPSYGITRVFTITNDEYSRLMKNSRPFGEED